MNQAINACRICKSSAIIPILSLGDLYVSDFIDPEKIDEGKGVHAPLELVFCDVAQGGCGLLQLKHTISPDIMYGGHYWYLSGVTQTMKNALLDIVQKAEKLILLKKDDVILDIGCNDGTLLSAYSSKGLLLGGFEPSKNLISYASKVTPHVINDFFNYNSYQKVFGEKKAKIITSIAMFYDLEEPNEFVADITKIIDDHGLWIIQMSYLPLMLEQNAFDNICHEHLEYYSLSVLQYLLEKHGLRVVDVELNEVNGGSIRTYIVPSTNTTIIPFLGAEERVQRLLEREKELGLDTRKVYDEFSKRVEHIKKEVSDFIRHEVDSGKKVYVYGASTKGNTLLQYFGLNHSLITAAAERSPAKWGRVTIKTHIPIISEEQARQEKPDYFLILPWAFLEEFRKREVEFLNSGGKFIIPLPIMKVE